MLMVFIIVMGLYTDGSDARDIGECQEETALGTHCFSPGTRGQYDGACILVGTAHRCHIPDTRDFKFTLRVSVRQLRVSKPNARPLDKFWIRGSGPGLEWNKPRILQKSATGLGLWVTDITYKYDSEASLCQNSSHCVFNQRTLEFRVYQDEAGLYDMTGPNLYVNLPISHSMYGHQHFRSPSVDVHPWFGGRSVTVEDMTQSEFPPPFNEVKVDLLYPPSFDFNVRRKYPVVILFGTGDGLQISPLLETMYVIEASIQEAFFINIHYSDSAPFCAYNPYSQSTTGTINSIWKCNDEESCNTFDFCWSSGCDKESFIEGTHRYLHPVKCGGSGETMLDIIEKHLIPKLKSKVQNRLILDFPKNRLSLIGFDGAGLLACHAALSRPHIYQNAACLSAPFHWPLNVLLANEASVESAGIGKVMKNISHYFMFYPERKAFYTTQKFYIDYGEKDNYHFPIIDTSHYVDWFIDELQNEFSVPLKNILYFKKISRSNNNYFIRGDSGTEILNRVRMPLLFFLKTEGGPHVAFPNLIKPHVEAEEEKEEIEEEEEAIPEECLHQFHILQRRDDANSYVPIEVLFLSIGE